jgi:hypothetical protein
MNVQSKKLLLDVIETGHSIVERGSGVAFFWMGEWSSIMREASVLEELLEPVSRCFNVEVARALAALRVNERMQARVDELAERCNEGLLTAEEEEDYEAYVQASTLVGILQAKARRILAESQPG